MNENKGLSTGAVIGVALTTIAVLLLLAFIGSFIILRIKGSKSNVKQQKKATVLPLDDEIPDDPFGVPTETDKGKLIMNFVDLLFKWNRTFEEVYRLSTNTSLNVDNILGPSYPPYPELIDDLQIKIKSYTKAFNNAGIEQGLVNILNDTNRQISTKKRSFNGRIPPEQMIGIINSCVNRIHGFEPGVVDTTSYKYKNNWN